MIQHDDSRSSNIAEKGHLQDTRKGKINGTRKIAALLKCLNELQGERFTGYIKINFSQGSIARVEKFEEILKH